VLFYLDLDQFKIVNDTCGHAAGDELLRQVSELLRSNLRQRDTLARLGGDEFGLLIEHCPLEQAQLTAEKLRLALEEFLFAWEDQSFRISVSIGLVAVNAAAGSLDDVLQAADSACYVAKNAGRNRVHIYSTEGDTLTDRHHGELHWVKLIQDALAGDAFQLYAQRIVPVTEQPHGSRPEQYYELLLRLLDDSGQIITPGVFMPAAERFQLCDRIDHWVIDKAFRWLAEHPDNLQKTDLWAINLSGHSLVDQALQDHILTRLDEFSLAGASICFEITETAVIANLTQASRFIKTLKSRGCRFAVDSFGSGLSAFAYLKNLPVDFLKIDGLFVRDIADDPIDLAMVRSINEIAQLMGKKTVAEYVENDIILQHLRELGIDYAQGFAIDPPKPLGE
jgi:diguanylate cyclase (GGDEF)-like protein